MSGVTRRSILGQLAIFAAVGPPLGGVLACVTWARLDLWGVLLIVFWSYALVLPVIAAVAAGFACAQVSGWLYRTSTPNPVAYVGIGALSGLLSVGVVMLLLAVVGGWSWSNGSDRALILQGLRSGAWAGGVCALLAWCWNWRLSHSVKVV